MGIVSLITQALRVVHHTLDLVVELAHNAVLAREQEIKGTEYQCADNHGNNDFYACVNMTFAFSVKQN